MCSKPILRKDFRVHAALFGATFSPVTSEEKQQYRISNGVKITSVSDGRLRDLGLGRGTIVVDINGEKVNNASDVRKATNDEKNLSSIEGFTPDGTYFKYQTRR